MSMLKGFVVFVLMFFALTVSPPVARAATSAGARPREVRVVTTTVPRAADGTARMPSKAELRRYAEREAAAPGLQGFEGGQTVVLVSVGAIAIVALIIAIVAL
ncbi:MAG TPA: hypothetical protein VGQ83_22415 [Polyangia bacterium]|jgi:hypothetical protein